MLWLFVARQAPATWKFTIMSELRKDPILDRWVIIAAERGRRPADFSRNDEVAPGGFDPFAPGNEDRTPREIAAWGRPDGAPADSAGWKVRVVPNKFPALSAGDDLDPRGEGIYDAVNGIGAHEVIIEHPRQDWDFDQASNEEMNLVLDAWSARLTALRAMPLYRHVLVFRNVGSAAGATIAHPHSQVIAVPILPKLVREELEAARAHFERKRRSIYADLLRQELADHQRVVEENDDFVVLCPFAARFPFEVQIFPRHHCHDFTLTSAAQREALGDILSRTLRRLKSALGNPAYNLMLQTAPAQHEAPGHPDCLPNLDHVFCWHINILPRMTNVAGFEWATGFYINPVAPEKAALYLRDAG